MVNTRYNDSYPLIGVQSTDEESKVECDANATAISDSISKDISKAIKKIKKRKTVMTIGLPNMLIMVMEWGHISQHIHCQTDELWNMFVKAAMFLLNIEAKRKHWLKRYREQDSNMTWNMEK